MHDWNGDDVPDIYIAYVISKRGMPTTQFFVSGKQNLLIDGNGGYTAVTGDPIVEPPQAIGCGPELVSADWTGQKGGLNTRPTQNCLPCQTQLGMSIISAANSTDLIIR